MLPRTFILHSEESLMIGGVAQIDVVALPSPSRPLSNKDYKGRRSGALVSSFWFLELCR